MKSSKNNEQEVFVAQGIEWLLKAGIIEHPDVQEVLMLNILMIDDKVNDVEFICDSQNFRILVFIELFYENNFFRKLMKKIKVLLKKEIDLSQEVIGQIAVNKLHQVLPNFDIRATFNRAIYDKSLKIAEKIIGSKKELYIENRNI